MPGDSFLGEDLTEELVEQAEVAFQSFTDERADDIDVFLAGWDASHRSWLERVIAFFRGE